MEAHNLAKLQQSAMPMDWGKRSGAEGETQNDAAADNDAAIEAEDAAAPQEWNKDNEAKALLFFLRPQQKVSK